MDIITNKNGTKLVCAIDGLAYARLRNGRLVIESIHEGVRHANSLTPDDLRKLADILENSVTLSPEQAGESA